MQKSTIIATVAAATGGILIGALGASAPADPAPAVTVTATPAPAPTVTVTAEAAPAAPQACLDAILDAENIMNLSADLMDIWREHMGNDEELLTALMMTSDWDAVDAYTTSLEVHAADIKDISSKVTTSSFNENKQKCRNS